jgi:hypothetical protein
MCPVRPAEAALVDLALGRPVERQAHLLQVEDRVDGLFRHDLGGVLVDQVVAALDRVEGVPFPVVFFDVRQRGAHAALCRAGVGPRRVELGEDRGAGALAGFDGRAHAGAAGADDHHVVLVELHWRLRLTCGGRQLAVRFGSKVKITIVPTARISTIET